MRLITILFSLSALSMSHQAFAHGKATCNSGPKSDWQDRYKLEKKLSAKGWKVKAIKEDGGCYEVYAIDDKQKRVEVYFHPVTLAEVPTK